MLEMGMMEVVQNGFWLTSTALVSLIVPITAIKIVFSLFFAGLYGNRRD